MLMLLLATLKFHVYLAHLLLIDCIFAWYWMTVLVASVMKE